jgi:hypothetical protein
MNRAFNDRNNIVIYEAECILLNLIVNILIMHIIWKKCLSNYHFLISGIFIILLISVPESAWASNKSPYKSDYDYGCDDAGISESLKL